MDPPAMGPPTLGSTLPWVLPPWVPLPSISTQKCEPHPVYLPLYSRQLLRVHLIVERQYIHHLVEFALAPGRVTEWTLPGLYGQRCQEFEDLLSPRRHACQHRFKRRGRFGTACQARCLFLGGHNHRVLFILHKLQLFQRQAISNIEVMSQFKRGPLALGRLFSQLILAEFCQFCHELYASRDHLAAYLFIRTLNGCHTSSSHSSRFTSRLYKRSSSS